MERIDASVRDSLRGVGVPDAGALAAAGAAWPECVGPGIARAAWPLRLGRDGTLHVACVSSTWAFELGRMAPEILEALRAKLGGAAPASLRFAPGPVPAGGAAGPAESSALPAPGPHDRAAAESAAAAISDAELRATVVRAVAASLALRRADRAF